VSNQKALLSIMFQYDLEGYFSSFYESNVLEI